MTCTVCAFAASPDFAFCPRCGAPLPSAARTHATTVAAPPAPAGAARPQRAPLEADRRIVSVLFADLSGFTTLSEHLDPEDVRALQSDLIHELSAAVDQYDGFIEKYVGDAVLAVFGAPVAHEDDPERALGAALAMRERVAALSGRWQRRLGAELALHIGVNTGPVVAGQVGTGAAAAYAVTGDTVNTAARLQGHAGPGEVVVSESTYQLTEHAFAFDNGGAVALKGKAESIRVYRLVGPHATPRRARGLGACGLATPMVGRDAELRMLERTLARMLEGATQVVSVVGEAGAGKSRLASEFLALARRRGLLEGCAVRHATCLSTGEQPYGVIAALIRDAYGLSTDDTLETARAKLAEAFEDVTADYAEAAHLAGILGHVLGLVVEDPLVHELEPDQLKRQLFIAVRAAVERRLRLSALLLVIEDLHWADAASLELLGFLLDRLASQRLMLLVTQRAAATFHARGTNAEHTTIRLEPLRATDCDRLLSACFGTSEEALPERVRRMIVERAGGNPLFLEEVLRSLIDRGVLARRDGGWVHEDATEGAAVPLTLHGLLLSRIDRLRPAARAVLQEAAVIGPVFDEALVSAIGERAHVAGVLAELEDAELLVPGTAAEDDARRAQGTYRFRHGLLQEAVYHNLLVRRRTELHTRVGAALERRYGERPQRLEEIEALGHHWSLSEDRARGARYLIAAGDWARSIFANEDALRHYRRALETLTECEGGDSALPALHERLGDVLGMVGRGAEAIAHHERALACHERLGDIAGRARQLRKIAELAWSAGDRAAARAHLQQALALLQDGAGHIARAQVYQTMGRHAFRSGDSRAAAEWARRALEDGELAAAEATDREQRQAAVDAVAHAHNTLGVALAQMGDMRGAVEHLERTVAIAFENGLSQAGCRGMANLAVLYSTTNPRRAIDTCTRGLEAAKKIGDFALQSRLYSNLAVAYCALTNRCDERGIGAAHAAMDLDRRLGQLDHLTVPLIVLAQIQQCHGQPEAALRYYREALALAEQTGEAQLLFPCYDGLASLHLEAGDDAEAERYMIQAQAVCRRAGVEPDTLVVLPFLD